jgi:hypothetical protein
MAFEQLGVVTITVDLSPGGAGRRNILSPRGSALTRLLELFDLYEIPATWGAAEPAATDQVEEILAAQARHEIALLGNATWVGAAAGRPHFAGELARRVTAARAAALNIRALLVAGVRVPREHYDLLIKHQLAVVRQPRVTSQRAVNDGQPLALRHGLWESPAACVIPRLGPIWGRGGAAARAAVRRAIASGGVVHVAFDVAALAADDPRMHTAESLLRYVARCCGRGALRAATLSNLAEEWSRPHAATPARSILRAA